MIKALKIIGWSLLGIVVFVYIFLFASYNGYKPDKVDQVVSEEALAYFSETYDEARGEFLSEVGKLNSVYENMEISKIRVPSKSGLDLFVDYAYIPAQDTNINLVILTSGIHGVEGYTGSAIQQMVMKEVLSPELLKSTGLLMVHGINPYGFKVIRRVSENNVDLNRNCAIDPKLYNAVNEGYGNLYGMLNPDKEADHATNKNRNFHLIAVSKIVAESMPVLRQAVLQGQYEYPEGLYFGGEALEPQFKSLKPLFADIMGRYQTVASIDLHTGYGANGVLHLFPNPIDDPKVKQGLGDLFDGYKIDWGDSDDFYTINGSFVDWLGSLSEVNTYLPMVFEYGTFDSQKTFGSIKSLHQTLLENQGRQFGFKSDKAEEKIMTNFREMYYPSSEEWRTKVIVDTKEIMEQMFEKLK